MLGETFSHYRILGRLGEGGMGEVFRAEDLTLGRQVAVKFLASHLCADEDARRRFLHEARAAAALDHPGICPVHEVGEAAGRPFIAMALLEGRTLKERVAEGPLPLAEALAVAAQVADALAEAHGHGIVHRDVKPANIMLTPRGQAKVMDFGLACLPGSSRVTQSGTTLGTAAYMAPEQARGEPADHRADLWALGVTLYEMVCGRRPFDADHAAGLAFRIQHDEPEPLTGRRTGVPIELDRIVGRCLAKNPADRYRHADELAADLRLLAESLTAGRRPAVPLRRRAPARRWVALGAIAALAAGGALLLATMRAGRGPTELTVAIVDFQDLTARDDPLTAACLTNLVQVGMVEKCPVRVLSPEYVQDVRRRLFGQTEGAIREGEALQIARKAGAALLLSGHLGQAGAAPFVSWHLVETAKGHSLAASRLDDADLVRAADRIIADATRLIAERARRPAPAATGSVEQITTKSPEAFRHYVAGVLAAHRLDFNRAERELNQALDADSTFVLAHARLADMYFIRERNELAAAHAERAWSRRDALGVKDRMLVEARRALLGGRQDEAFATYREALARWPDDRFLIDTVSQTQMFYWEVEAAEATSRRGLALFPEDAQLLGRHALSLNMLGRTDEALAVARAWRRREPSSALVWNSLGEVFLAAGQPDSALEAFRTMQRVDPTNAVSYNTDLSRCLFAQGDVEGAIRLCLRLWSDKTVSLEERRDVLYRWSGGSLAQYCLEAGHLRLALSLFDSLASLQPDRASRRAVLRWGLNFAFGRSVVEEAPDLTRRLWASADSLIESAKTRTFWICQVEADSARAVGASIDDFWRAPVAARIFVRCQIYRARISLLVAAGLPEAALAEIDSMQRLAPFHMFENWPLHARVLRAAGRHAEAADLLRDVLRRSAGYYTAHYWLGRACEELGRRDEAVREYRTFLELWKDADPEWPQPGDARRRLASLGAS